MIHEIQHTILLRSDEPCVCTRCDEMPVTYHHQITDHANHYIQQHGYVLLHVGQETVWDDNGNPWHCTVMVLGTRDAPRHH